MVEILLFFMNAAKYYILRFFKVAKRFIMDPFDKPRREKIHLPGIISGKKGKRMHIRALF